ncbi:hypothetical protein BgiMline_010371, partial [Biomphalaria glabrata]
LVEFVSHQILTSCSQSHPDISATELQTSEVYTGCDGLTGLVDETSGRLWEKWGNEGRD